MGILVSLGSKVVSTGEGINQALSLIFHKLLVNAYESKSIRLPHPATIAITAPIANSLLLLPLPTHSYCSHCQLTPACPWVFRTVSWPSSAERSASVGGAGSRWSSEGGWAGPGGLPAPAAERASPGRWFAGSLLLGGKSQERRLRAQQAPRGERNGSCRFSDSRKKVWS